MAEGIYMNTEYLHPPLCKMSADLRVHLGINFNNPCTTIPSSWGWSYMARMLGEI
jgi:hypothetical protein